MHARRDTPASPKQLQQRAASEAARILSHACQTAAAVNALHRVWDDYALQIVAEEVAEVNIGSGSGGGGGGGGGGSSSSSSSTSGGGGGGSTTTNNNGKRALHRSPAAQPRRYL